MKYTNKLNNAIYSADTVSKIYDASRWGDDIEEAACIDGELAMNQAAKDNVVITGKLQAGVGYIFRWTQKGDKLVPYHVTMLPKTAANLEKGSRRYGSASILADVLR